MKTKTIFKALAFAMMMPAMLLTTACSSSDDSIINDENTNNKGFALPVTVNVTRQGDKATTRASYNEGTRKLSFSTGDKLFVKYNASYGPGKFAGTLDYVPGSEGTFSGTIYTKEPYSGTAIELFEESSEHDYVSANLLPSGYEFYNYLSINNPNTYYAELEENYQNLSFTSTKAEAVEQFSYENGGYFSGSGIHLGTDNAILNFTITGLEPSSDVTVELEVGDYYTIYGSVATYNETPVTFATGLTFYKGGEHLNINLSDLTLKVEGKIINLNTGSDTEFQPAGYIYNITRSVAPAPAAPEGAINGKFTINAGGDQVYFSQGNLQATTTDLGGNWTWAFAEHQWDYIGNAASNTSINGNGTVSANGTVDLFGWVGASNTTWTGAAMYGISNSQTTESAETYGTEKTDVLKSDWGNTIGSGWRMLTPDQWNYLFWYRTASTVGGTANGCFAKATVNSVAGVILFPDSYTHPSDVTTPVSVNTDDATFTANSYDGTAWGKMESAGAVFLPAAGYRDGSSVYHSGSSCRYWSSAASGLVSYNAYCMYIPMNGLYSQYTGSRHYGYSVRLVRAAN